MADQIIPPKAAPLRTLMVTMAVMSFLACLAIGALILVDRAVNAWTKGLSGEFTVQLREIRGQDMEPALAAAKAIIDGQPGVKGSTILTREESVKLLEPWLGSNDLQELPVPRLIRVQIDPSQPPYFTGLADRLAKEVKGADLDTHERWVDELTSVAGSLTRLAWLVLGLITLSAITMVIFATRAALAANSDIVDVLHLVGASDGFIARQIDRQFITTGLFAGLLGLVAGLVTFYALGLMGGGALIAMPDGQNWGIYVALAALPIAATLIALVTSRLALMRMLRARP
jgi:cell division transport system permease protein